jgi:hypothetical protein
MCVAGSLRLIVAARCTPSLASSVVKLSQIKNQRGDISAALGKRLLISALIWSYVRDEIIRGARQRKTAGGPVVGLASLAALAGECASFPLYLYDIEPTTIMWFWNSAEGLDQQSY